ncbi:D-alanyl-D-alanine carboxypeptidase family protein [Consotaella aegiceratis]|uniref:D-alanyl-D-alanine carboxypeptidase family protein n=1 Tax=Consotaella aegiceratis TaxID=3097961 RepID=UPI002F3FE5A6
MPRPRIKDVGRARVTARAACLAFATFVGLASPAAAIETSAPHALLVDFATGDVLYEKDADAPVPPASLAKLMTVEVMFHELETGQITLDEEFPVSEYAWRTGGASSGSSTMFLPVHSMVSVDDLIKGIIIQSGNDAAIVSAEGIAGSSDVFADMMNQRAKEIGLTGSHFTNPDGLPDENMYVTMRDLAHLAEHLIKAYPDRYPIFAEEEFTFNGITQHNRNPLLGLGMGADGLKTGHTSEAGYGLVASAKQGDRRVVLAMSGMKSIQERSDEARKLLGYGFSAFEQREVLAQGTEVASAAVSGGQAESVPLVATEGVQILAARGSADDIETRVNADPVLAPVAEGDQIGTYVVSRGGKVLREVPLVAGHAVERASLLQRSWDGFKRVTVGSVSWAVNWVMDAITGGDGDEPSDQAAAATPT